VQIAEDIAWGIRKDGKWVQEKSAPLPFMRNTRDEAARMCIDPSYEPRQLRTLVYDITDQSIATSAADAMDAERAHGHRDDFHLLANARRFGLMPIHQVVRMPNWVVAHELFATGSNSARQICIDAGIDPDGLKIERAAIAASQQGDAK
jgi:hypothetical protein